MEKEISLTVVGRISTDEEDGTTFTYQYRAYKKLLEWDHFDSILGINIKPIEFLVNIL